MANICHALCISLHHSQFLSRLLKTIRGFAELQFSGRKHLHFILELTLSWDAHWKIELIRERDKPQTFTSAFQILVNQSESPLCPSSIFGKEELKRRRRMLNELSFPSGAVEEKLSQGCLGETSHILKIGLVHLESSGISDVQLTFTWTSCLLSVAI